MSFVVDSFTDTDGTTLASHTGETGATWTEHPSYAGNTAEIASDRCRKHYADGNNTLSLYYVSGAPASADYDVQADFVCVDVGNGGLAMIAGRMDTTNNTRYYVVYDFGDADKAWKLFKVVAGAFTQLGSNFPQSIANGDVHTAILRMRGSAISVLIDGTTQISATDAGIAAAGSAGLGLDRNNDTTAMQLDNFSASNPANAISSHFLPLLGVGA